MNRTIPARARGDRRRWITPLALALAGLLAGCATAKGGEPSALGEAATRPLRDVGLVRTTPAAALAAAARTPYALAEGVDCAGIGAEIAELTDLLGPDIDATPEASDSVVEALAAQALGGIVDVPFRGVVRRVTGAEARDSAMRRARLGGQLRRAFLKGLARGRGCPEGNDGEASSSA